MALTWNEELHKKIKESFGKKSSALEKKYANAFPHGYQDDFSTQVAISDIDFIEKLSKEKLFEIQFYISNDKTDPHPLHLRLFQWETPIPLSDILPMLENMDLRTYNERPHKIKLGKDTIWISDFAVVYTKQAFKIDEDLTNLFEDAFINIFLGLCENDGFNKLILGAGMSWREIMILRAYAKYLRQIGFRFSQAYIEKTLAEYPHITKALVNLFLLQHDPKLARKKTDGLNEIEPQILKDLEAVSVLDEDKILRKILELIKATLRTNYFQTTKENHFKSYLSLKLSSRLISELPKPSPLYEIFVYSPQFEAIHLRNSKIARGGIRWSDRKEDFRTEILGLMKAQVVKNSIIVPSGAKGGFVLKTPPMTNREALLAEVIDCYKSFMRGLLDITDNIKNKKIIPPTNVVCHDDDDPYLVVAADKGTASFSDIANDISAEYDFWLGDAFASGGSAGYDHKKIGITARGAWESIKRHFRELDIDTTQTDISVVGIGDLSGDVFGNGMIYSNHLKLVAAFDHRDIFLDPDPNPEISYQERVRIFNLPASSWQDYNPKLISKGGGVFKRSSKSIKLSPQVQKILDTDAKELAPNELIRTLLKAPVDLLFNGGIGTYVKASTESNADVSDRTNDYCRINGNEIRARVVGEGGNLGFTQLGRIEYALTGGLINTDFIDNSAGVDCSDHEVNLKILLSDDVQKGKLSLTNRNKLLSSVTDSVANLVLKDNYHQALVMSFSAFHANKNITLHTQYLKELETQKIINRQVEFLPDDKSLIERQTQGKGLTRPEMAVLLAYTKIFIKHEILKSNLANDPFLSGILTSAFPPEIAKKYQDEMQHHKLRTDIVATQLSNRVVNEMGFTYVYRIQTEMGASVSDVVRAHAVASHIFDTHILRKYIESLDFKIPLSEQYELLYNLRNLINLTTRWFLNNNRLKGDMQSIISHYSERIKKLESLVPTLMAGYTKDYLDSLTERFIKLGLDAHMAKKVATYRAIYTTLNIVEVATKHNFELKNTAKTYFLAGEQLNLVWFRDQIATDSREGHWNVIARLTLRDELDYAQRALTTSILKRADKTHVPSELIQNWMTRNNHLLERWNKLLTLLHSSTSIDYTMFFIALKELIGLISNSA